jgi:DNA-binding NarL/FixJ family response regulator
MDANYYTAHFPLHLKEEQETAYSNITPKPLLIVDDSPLIVNKMKEWLEELTVLTSIESCSTFARAVDWLSVYKPAVVLLDIDLPDKSGIILLKHIKAFYPEIPVIMITNLNNDFYKNLCLELGARFFLDKSNDFEKLSALVAFVIQ